MSAELMEADETASEAKDDSNDSKMDTQSEENFSDSGSLSSSINADVSMWLATKEETRDENILTNTITTLSHKTAQVENVSTNANSVMSLPKKPIQQRDLAKSVWTVRSPLPLKYANPKTYTQRRKSHENYSTKQTNGSQNSLPNSKNSRDRFSLPIVAQQSSFKRKNDDQNHLSGFMEDSDYENNILKRCNSAPILNEADDNSIGWIRPLQAGPGRIRRFSANVVSLSSSPALARSRLRLHQLQKEESLEGIQNKETEHEREVQTTILIASNCGELTLSDRRCSLDSSLSSSPRTSLSPSSVHSKSSHFPIPTSTLSAVKSIHSRSIDFGVPLHPPGGLSPTQPHYPSPHHPPSGGIPSPLTFIASPCLNLSPLPPSPTRGLSGPGKQCFSPSMQVPVSLARAASRSPSPSPTRRTFVTRRRSQSPCIMRPSALGPLKRKYDSDSEGSYSPKRMLLQPSTVAQSGGSGDAAMTLANSTPHINHRTLVHRSHSLSSSSVDSSDLYVSPSPPHQPTSTFITHHHGNHHVSGFSHPLHHSSSPLQGNNNSSSSMPHVQLDQPNRCASPASSTCSSSSLEGLRDLQPLTSTQQVVGSKKS